MRFANHRPNAPSTSTGAEQVLSLLESVLLPLIEQVGLAAAQIHDLRTAVSVLLEQSALLAVVGVRNAGATADHTPALVGAVVALVADANQRTRPHVRVADHALAIALLAETSYGPGKREKEIR